VTVKYDTCVFWKKLRSPYFGSGHVRVKPLEGETSDNILAENM